MHDLLAARRTHLTDVIQKQTGQREALRQQLDALSLNITRLEGALAMIEDLSAAMAAAEQAGNGLDAGAPTGPPTEPSTEELHA